MSGLSSWLISNNISNLKSIDNITIQILIVLFFASIGSWLGSKKIGENEVKIILSLILFFASYKLIISWSIEFYLNWLEINFWLLTYFSKEVFLISLSNFDNCSKLLSFQILPKEKIAYLAISDSLFKEYL